MSELIKMLKEAIMKLEKREALTVAEEEKLKKYSKELEALRSIPMENTLQSRIAPTGRGAVFQLRKVFYATLSDKGYDRDLSVAEWKKMISKLIDFMNEKGLSEIPTKIIVEYSEEEQDGKKVIKFKKARIFYFELAGSYTLDFE
ncbi:MAG TPA: hypothetical protein ENF55_01775 [Thermoprotei archaeon]|nr:hypothetical protein [Thermoprotei archaeon]